MPRPSLKTKCVADTYADKSRERIAEFSFPAYKGRSLPGGLISLRNVEEGRPVVELYRVDGCEVRVARDKQAHANPDTSAPIGRLWWSADSAEEAATWARDCIERGAAAVTIKAADAGRCDVIVAIHQDETAGAVAGYEIEADEWMEPLNRARIRTLCQQIREGYAQGLSGMDGPQLDRIMALADLAEDIGILAQDTATEAGNVLPVVWLPRAAADKAERFLTGFEDDTDNGNAEFVAEPLQALRAALATGKS